MSKLAIAVIGAGAIGRAHVDTIRRSEHCRLAGIAEPAVAGKDYADSLGVPWRADHAALLDDVKPDAAIIATPNATHREVAIACVDRGIPAIVEKPIASSLADAAAIVAASEQSAVPILVGHHRRYNPIIRRARRIVLGGTLGRLTNATVLAMFYKPQEYFELAWRRQPGGGPVLINLIDEIDLIRHLCGEIATVQAVTSNATRGFEVEDTAAVLLRLVGGALVTLSASAIARPRPGAGISRPEKARTIRRNPFQCRPISCAGRRARWRCRRSTIGATRAPSTGSRRSRGRRASRSIRVIPIWSNCTTFAGSFVVRRRR